MKLRLGRWRIWFWLQRGVWPFAGFMRPVYGLGAMVWLGPLHVSWAVERHIAAVEREFGSSRR